MKKFIRWLKALRHWSTRVPITQHYWWAIALVGIAIAGVGFVNWSEAGFRISGIVLQLGGVLTVVWGILKTRAGFGLPTVRSQFSKWVKAFPTLRTQTVTFDSVMSTGAAVFAPYISTTHGPAVDQTNEGRLAHLENIVKKLEVLQGATHVAVLQAEKEAQKAIDAQANQLAEQIAAVEKRNEANATGGVHVSAVGVIFLFVGTIFGGLSPELHCLMSTC